MSKYSELEKELGIDLSFLDDMEPETPAAPAPKKPAARPLTPDDDIPAPTRKSVAAAQNAKKPAPKSVQPAKPAAKAPQGAKAPQQPVKKAAAAPAQQKAAAPKKSKKKGPRLGGVIFYTLYFLFIFVFFVGTFIGLNWLRDWLVDFEAAQPTVKAEQVFTQLFTSPDWGALYESAGAKDSAYEGKDAYVNYMTAKVGSTPLNYMETSAGLSGDKKFIVRLGDEKVASFTLVDKNGVGQASLDNLENITDIPDWQLGSVEVFFERIGDYLIEKVDGHTAYVNNVPLDDSLTIQIATTMASEYLPAGTTGASMCTQKVSGLMEKPQVTIFDEDGKEMIVTYDEASRTFTERTESNTITPEQEERALEAARTYCLWMIEEVSSRGTIAKYFDPAGKPYDDIVHLGELWMQGHAGYEFADQSVTKFASYGENLFSAFVSMDLNVTRKDGTVKSYEFDKTLFFENQKGKWMITDWTNVDVSKPVGKVRLTFMNGDTEIFSDFFQNDKEKITIPVIPTPEGQVFSGWVRQDIGEDGTTTLTVVFEPDETGTVKLPQGNILEPMTLYAYFEDAATAEAAPAETAAPTEGA